MRIGFFEHWHRPPYTLAEFLQEEGIEIVKIDFSQKGYLEPFDVAIVEQNGFNDYIENVKFINAQVAGNNYVGTLAGRIIGFNNNVLDTIHIKSLDNIDYKNIVKTNQLMESFQ